MIVLLNTGLATSMIKPSKTVLVVHGSQLAEVAVSLCSAIAGASNEKLIKGSPSVVEANVLGS